MKKILLVDDEPQVLDLVAATFAGDDRYTVLTAGNADEAFKIALRERPDLIFLDIMMPHVDGYELCRRLKGNPTTSHATILMLTALAQEADMRRARVCGADGYFTKPFSPTTLLGKLEEVLFGSHAARQQQPKGLEQARG